MAILKHIASKSADYGRAIEYLMYEQDRLKNESLRNERGNLVMRKNFLIDSLECNVATFDMECEDLNRTFHKNLSYGDIKSHHYIISFDPKDSVEGKLTLEDVQRIGMDFAKKNFPGHQAVVCAHDDGENRSGNMHVHIIINSLRKRDVERRPFMERRCDSRAGFKHHLTDKYFAYLKQEVMDICRDKKLHQVDLLSPAKKRVTEQEYWADVRGKRAHGSDFVLRKEQLRKAIEDCAKDARSEKEFARLLKERYNIVLKVSRGRYGYILPEREKPIRGRMLGAAYTEEYLQPLFAENAKARNAETRHSESRQHMDETYLPPEFFMPTKIRLVKDLQTSALSSVSRAYDRRAKINNLKQMANTIMYVENHGYETKEALDSAYDGLHGNVTASRTALKRSEDGIKALNEQIHYTGQYLANKSTYAAYMKAKNKGRFRSEHEAEIILYEAARKYLKDHANDGTLPSLAYIDSAPGKFVPIDRLKAKRAELIKEQKELRSAYHSARDAEKELYVIKKNVDTMLQEPSLNVAKKRHKQESID